MTGAPRAKTQQTQKRAANWPRLYTSSYYEALQGGTWATARISASVVYRHLQGPRASLNVRMYNHVAWRRPGLFL
jgi:hypothetical protein